MQTIIPGLVNLFFIINDLCVVQGRLAKEILRQDPELEDAKFEILDFSAVNPKESRQLRIIDAADIQTFNSKETAEMLAIFVEGFERAEARLKKVDIPSKRKETEDVIDINQYNLWD